MLSFEESLKTFDEVLDLYKSRWTLASYEWEDLKQDIRAHAFKKWHLFQQDKPLKPWAARLIQNFMKNELRNRYYRYQAPCLKCDMHLGDGGCKLYGDVSAKCALFKKFIEQKGSAANIHFPVSYEQSNYDAVQEFSCTPKDFAEDIYLCLSGVHKQIFHLFYESGFSTTRIARHIQVSGMDFNERFELIETSIDTSYKVAKEIVQEKRIAMGLKYGQ